ncbi:MAG: glycosyltransferase [Candidatus Berkelbacteria bacterium]
MKILLASESFPPNVSGVATATKNLAQNLVKFGHTAIVITPGNVRQNKKDDRFPDYDVIRIASIPNPFRKGFRIAFSSKNRIKKILLETKPDLVHLQDPAAIGTLVRDTANDLGIPVVITNHFSLEYALSYVKGLSPIIPLLRQGLITYLANFYNHCDQVVTPTETFVKQVRQWGVKKPVIAVSNGIDVSKFITHFTKDELDDFRKSHLLPDGHIILYLGRADKDKSIDVIIRSIPEVASKCDAHFVIAGTGGEIENLKKLATELNVDKNVTFLGFLDQKNDDKIKMFKSATVFAIPSTIETQSIVTLEALASRVPVVAADAGALPELVIDGKDGYLIKPGDHQALAKHLIEIIKDKKKQQDMGDYGFTIAMHHQMDTAFKEMLALYKEVIERKKKS